MTDILASLVLAIIGGFVFFRGLRPFLLEEPYTLMGRVQLVGGFLATAYATVWLMDAIVTSMAP